MRGAQGFAEIWRIGCPTLRALVNPVTHTGKLYNLLAERMAHALVGEIPGVEAAQRYLLGQIGSPIDQPQVADIRLGLADPVGFGTLRPAAEEIVRTRLRAATGLWREVIAGPAQCVDGRFLRFGNQGMRAGLIQVNRFRSHVRIADCGLLDVDQNRQEARRENAHEPRIPRRLDEESQK